MIEENSIKTRSTSLTSAVANDIVLDEIPVRENEKFRLIFRPEIVQNPHDAEACVRGHFLYQRKKDKGLWADYKTFDLSRLKEGEWIKLELKAGEVKKLIEELRKHYAIFKKFGIEPGSNEYIFGSQEIVSLIKQFGNNEKILKEFLDKGGEKILPQFLEWISTTDDPQKILAKLQEVKAHDLKKVNNIIGIANIKRVLTIWEENKNNNNEEFWQQTIKENSWLISQLFATPVVIFADKAYVGGKSILNKDGQISDFLYKNALTTNIAIVEIKTPTTQLVSAVIYRDNIYSISKYISGGVVQVLSQKDTLTKEYNSLNSNSPEKFSVCNPKTILIAGSLETLINEDQKRSFDLFRSNIDGLEIITFDELFKKTELLIELLEGQKEDADENTSREDIPF